MSETATAIAEPLSAPETILEPSFTAVDHIMELAMKLSWDERAELLERLDESFAEEDMTPEEKAAFVAELDRRMEEHRRDPSSAIDAEEVFRKLGLQDEPLS